MRKPFRITLSFLAAAAALAGSVRAEPDLPVDGHFSNWQKVPDIIDSITGTEYRDQLEQLHQITRIKLGFPQSSECLNDKDHHHYMLQTKQNWMEWWKSTGKPVSALKSQGAKPDEQAFDLAWKFLGMVRDKPNPILPVWIPETWTLYVTYKNGDYGGLESELWVIERKAGSASLTKLRGAYQNQTLGPWEVTLSEHIGFTPQQADEVLKALCYLHQYAPVAPEGLTENIMPRLYYPHATLRLRDGENRVLWNTEGYEFSKSRPEHGEGAPGRTCYFLKTLFPPGHKWLRLVNPTNSQLAPYHRYLSFSKPHLSSCASEIIQLFGQHGGGLEKQSMLDWAEKQKLAAIPTPGWKACADDFGAESPENVRNFTRLELQDTLREIKKIGDRLAAQPVDRTPDGGDHAIDSRTKEKELEGFVTSMLATAQKEEEDAIQSVPQPLRDLIKADEHPDDPDLKHLAAAIQAIRNAPDPLLFAQLVGRMNDDSVEAGMLLGHILLNEGNLLKLKPWDEKNEAIAVAACIDALPLAGEEARDELLKTLLMLFGGGKIEIEDPDGGQSIEVIPMPDGHRCIFDSPENPLPIKAVQAELHKLYAKSKVK